MSDDHSTTIADLKAEMQAFVAEREWQPFHDPKNLSMSLAIEAAELMEHFQWLRSEELPALAKDEARMQAVREEVADVAAYLISFATTMNIDLATAFREKMKKNAVKYPADEFRGRSGQETSS